jgi:uracil phosphoribosyltransferase
MGPAGANVVGHPAVAYRLAELRDAGTGRDRFRVLLAEISALLAYEALPDLATATRQIRTPVGTAEGAVVDEQLLVVPILRAGLGMVAGVQAVIPGTEVAHVGMRRDERTLEADTYLDGLPRDLGGRRVLVCDPMLATGGTLGQGVGLVAGRGASQIAVLCVLAAAPGLARFNERFPSVAVTCAAIDPELDERGYIVPGLGDAGDRLFGPPPP